MKSLIQEAIARANAEARAAALTRPAGALPAHAAPASPTTIQARPPTPAAGPAGPLRAAPVFPPRPAAPAAPAQPAAPVAEAPAYGVPQPAPAAQPAHAPAYAPAYAPAPAAAPEPAPKDETDAELEAILSQLNTKIKVVGCGGGGSNTIHRLAGAGLKNVELVACNTDAQHLLQLGKSATRILIGKHLTKGLGAGALPQIGEKAALETEEAIRKQVTGADMVFVTAGMGGGTGTGSAPVVAKIAKDSGALVIAVVTLPFAVEGAVRRENAEAGLARLRDVADTTIVIPNDKLLELVPNLPLTAAFKVADAVLMRSIVGLTEMITKPGLVNLDFADLKTIMKKGGVAMIGLGESDSENRSHDAVEEALRSPLLDVDISNASGCLVDVVGGGDMTLAEAQAVVQTIHDRVSPDCRIIWGAAVDTSLNRTIRVMVVITGVKSNQMYAGPTGPTTIAGVPRPAPVAKSAKEDHDVDFVL